MGRVATLSRKAFTEAVADAIEEVVKYQPRLSIYGPALTKVASEQTAFAIDKYAHVDPDQKLSCGCVVGEYLYKRGDYPRGAAIMPWYVDSDLIPFGSEINLAIHDALELAHPDDTIPEVVLIEDTEVTP